MKRLLLWLIGVALGVVVLLAAVLGVSYSFTSEGAKPASEMQFAGQELEPNGWCWQVPLLGGQVDKVFASPRTLTVQKLGVLYDAHPAFALPEWYSYGPLTITDSAGNVVFEGTAATYDDFLFPANGDYKAELTVWRLPENMLATQFEGGSTGELRQDVRLEKPAKPIGWYYYSFRFTLQASAEVELSAERMEQGGTVGEAKISESFRTFSTTLGGVLQAASAGMGGAGAETMVGRALAAAPGAIGGAQGLVGGVGRALASGPAQNLAGGAAGGAAAEVARQQGASPALQMGAGLAGGLIGGGLASKTLDAPPVGPVAEAEAAGVRLMTSDVVPPKTFA